MINEDVLPPIQQPSFLTAPVILNTGLEINACPLA